MKRIFFAMIITVLFFSACGDKNEIVIKGDIAGLDDATVFLKIREEKVWVILDSCVSKQGKFSLHYSIKESQVAYLMSEDEMALPRTAIFLEPGRITINGTISDVNNLNFSGSKLNDEYQLVYKRINLLDQTYSQLYADYKGSKKSGDLMKMAAIKSQMDETEKEQEQIAKDYVNNHPKSAVSLLLINSQLIYTASAQELEAMKSHLDTSLYETTAMKKLDEKIAKMQQFEPGQPVPDISLPDTSGVVRTLSKLKGKYVLIDFWASWCPSCRIENPSLVDNYQEFHDKGLEIYAVSLDRAKEDWLIAIEADHLTWIHVSELKGWKGVVSQKFDIISIPSNLLIDPEGRIIGRNLFGDRLHDTLKEYLK